MRHSRSVYDPPHVRPMAALPRRRPGTAQGIDRPPVAAAGLLPSERLRRWLAATAAEACACEACERLLAVLQEVS